MAKYKVQSFRGHHDVAVSRGEEAVALNPTSAMAHQALGLILGRAGRPEEAIFHIKHAIRLSPRDLFLGGFLALGSRMLFDIGSYQDALEWASRGSRSPNPRVLSFMTVVAALSKLGRREEAADALADVLAHPQISSLQRARNVMDWNFPLGQRANEQLIDDMRDAGLPE